MRERGQGRTRRTEREGGRKEHDGDRDVRQMEGRDYPHGGGGRCSRDERDYT